MDLFFAVPALSISFTALGILLVIWVLGVHFTVESRRRRGAAFRSAASPVIERHLAGSAGLDEAVAVLETDLPAALALLLERSEASTPGERERLRTLFRKFPCQEKMLEGLDHRDGDVRAQNARMLGYLGGASTLPRLMRALDDESPDVRLAAADSLALHDCPAAVQTILKNPAFTGNMPVDRVAEVLARFGDSAVEGLSAALVRPEIPVRALAPAIQACGMLRAKQAVPGLLGLLHHPDAVIRRKTVHALGSIGDPSAAGAVSHLMDDPDPEVRSQVLSTLGILGSAAHIPGIVRALGDPRWEIRLSAARALYQMGGEGLNELRHAATRPEDSPARGISRQILQTHGHDVPAGKDLR